MHQLGPCFSPRAHLQEDFRRSRSAPSANRAESRLPAGVSPDPAGAGAGPVRKGGSTRCLLPPNCMFKARTAFCNTMRISHSTNLPCPIDSTGNIVAVRSCRLFQRKSILIRLCAGIRKPPVFVDVLQKYARDSGSPDSPRNVATADIHRFFEGFSLRTLDEPFVGVSRRTKPEALVLESVVLRFGPRSSIRVSAVATEFPETCGNSL
jgi:hypothetical protein